MEEAATAKGERVREKGTGGGDDCWGLGGDPRAGDAETVGRI